MKNLDPYAVNIAMSTPLWETLFLSPAPTEKSENLYMKGRMNGIWGNFT